MLSGQKRIPRAATIYAPSRHGLNAYSFVDFSLSYDGIIFSEIPG